MCAEERLAWAWELGKGRVVTRAGHGNPSTSLTLPEPHYSASCCGSSQDEDYQAMAEQLQVNPISTGGVNVRCSQVRAWLLF